LRVLLGRLDEAKRVLFILAELEGMTSRAHLLLQRVLQWRDLLQRDRILRERRLVHRVHRLHMLRERRTFFHGRRWSGRGRSRLQPRIGGRRTLREPGLSALRLLLPRPRPASRPDLRDLQRHRLG
jgi:hypothetical protein